MTLEFHAIQGLPIFKKGDDIGQLVSERFVFHGNDILLVASTIVSKSEGRTVLLDDIEPSASAKKIAKRRGDDPRFVELILQESRDVVEMDGLLLARTHFGHGVAVETVGDDERCWLFSGFAVYQHRSEYTRHDDLQTGEAGVEAAA